MWIFPLGAAAIALVFSVLLARQYAARRRPYQLVWALALLMYAIGSFMVVLGVAGDWSPIEYRTFWVLGAVLNVPFLAAGELLLLERRPWMLAAVVAVLAFVTAYSLAVVRGATIEAPGALNAALPSGKTVFGDGSAAHRLPQVVAIPAYLVLLLGTLWSAWQMRGAPQLRDRFLGTLGIAGGATIVAVVGSTFAALGNFTVFSVALAIGIAVMFWGFLAASRPPRAI